MPFKIIRNDITKMNTEAIVNTANDHPTVGSGCDGAVYIAAGHDELLEYRKEKIGFVPEGDAFITPGFNLKAKYIIHAVSPKYRGGSHEEEEKLRSCYRKSLEIAKEHHIKSIAFPLISTGGFGYPKEEGMRIAVDEIHAFLLKNNMQIFLVVFDEISTSLGESISPDLETYIDNNYVSDRLQEEYRNPRFRPFGLRDRSALRNSEPIEAVSAKSICITSECDGVAAPACYSDDYLDFEKDHESKLEERMKHMSDTFSEYLLYLIQDKQMENSEVWRRAIIDKKVFSKIKNDPHYHPKKLTALCLCVGAKLNLDETKDLLARAGYALSPCDKTDIIFSYFIENEIYDMIELDIQLEEHGLPCIIT